MKKSILFDLDGTLTDSGEGIINCAEFALRHFGIPVPARDTMRVFVGPPLSDTFMHFGVPESQVQEAIEVYRSRYIPVGKYENALYPGIYQVLEALHRDGFKLYVATSKPEAMSIEILEHFEIAKFFDRICGASMDSSRSTKDEVIAYLLEEVRPDGNLIMVGDTKYDVLGAAVHKLPTIGVSWGYGTVEDLMEAGAASIAHSPVELLSLLQNF